MRLVFTIKKLEVLFQNLNIYEDLYGYILFSILIINKFT